jgi:hypothetical protein
MSNMTPIAPRAEIIARIHGTSSGCIPAGLSTNTIACVVKMLAYRRSIDFGAVTGRYMVMRRQPTTHEAAGNIISIRKVG